MALHTTPLWVDVNGDGVREHTLLTANHVVGDRCSYNTWNTVTQNDSDWGTVRKSSKVLDAAAVLPDSNHDVAYHIEDGSVGNPEVDGYITENGVDGMCSTGESVYRMGVGTGHNEGTVDNTHTGDESVCSGFFGHGVRCEVNTYFGDSGCANFAMDGGKAYIISIHSLGDTSASDTNCNGDQIRSFSGGASAYRVRQEWDGWFSPA